MSEKSDPAIHRVRPRRWSTLGAAAATSLLVTSPMIAAWAAQGDVADGKPILLAQSGEGGEGGEAGGKAHDDEDADYFAALGYVSGHLRAGMALFEAGLADQAKTHMKHPGDEIYKDLAPELEEHGAPDFASELAALSGAVEQGKSTAEAKAAFDAVLAAIETARDAGDGGALARLDATVEMVRTAAEEYAEGVVDGKVVELHEYQDAWGFIQAARHDLDEVADGADASAAAVARKMLHALAETDAAFAGLAPEGAIDGDASILYGAAARMELAVYSLK